MMTSTTATPNATADFPRASLIFTPEEVNDWGTQTADLSRLLTDIACRIGNRLVCDVCSIYRIDRQRQSLILAATVGLRQDCVERLRMKITEGLCGLVVQQRRLVNVAVHAAEHPRFKYFPEAAEEPYESFLGVPVIDGAQMVGVLVVQTVEPRLFSTVDEQTLALSARQIGLLVAILTKQQESP